LVLEDQELYGYELIEEMKKHTAILIAEGTLYPLMNRLKTPGWVTAKWIKQASSIPRKYYVLNIERHKNLEKMSNYWY